MNVKNINESLVVEQRKDRKAVIEKIFNEIEVNDKFIIFINDKIQNGNSFKGILQTYKEALLKETDYLDLKYDHPLRSANALLCLSKSEDFSFQYNLTNFEKEANNSKFNPKTRIAAWCLLTPLISTLLVALVIGLATSSFVPFGMMLVASIPFLGPAGALIADAKCVKYKPVFSSIESGKNMASFFKQVEHPADYKSKAEEHEALDDRACKHNQVGSRSEAGVFAEFGETNPSAPEF